MASAKWLRLDEVENAVDNLETCYILFTWTRSPIRWKWVIVALHQALYGFAICAVQGTDCLSVLTKPSDPNSSLINIWTALERAKNARYLWPGSEVSSESVEIGGRR
jgi:hypothetical protein